MSRPRPVLAGRSYLITRRCTQRLFLMRPDPETNKAFIYCLAVAAARYEVDVLFTVAMSNHHHTGIYDKYGNYPAFIEYFHKLFAKCQNSLRGRWENFWSSEQTSVVLLVDTEDVLEKLVYAMCNPVQSGLVEQAMEWPGVSSLRAMLEGRSLHASRPRHFFRPNGPMPESAAVHLKRPPGFETWTEQDWRVLIRDKVKERERACKYKRARCGQRALGVQGILKQRWTSRPGTSRPARLESRRGLRPRVAAKNKWRRVEALVDNRQFLEAYRDARAALQAGIRTVLFPLGTYWLKRFANVVCEETPYLS